MSRPPQPPSPPTPPSGRVYRLRDATVVLAFFALTLLLLDADGLRSWANRMNVGPVQDFWQSIVGPWRAATDRVGLTAPRRVAVAAADRLGEKLAGSEGSDDALLARGWNPQGDAASESPSVGTPVHTFASGGAASRPAPGSASAPTVVTVAKATPPPGAVGEQDQPATVLLIGDSLMLTLAPSVVRAFAGDSTVEIVSAPRAATGLSRPDFYDWTSVAGSLVQAHRPLLVVCAFGGNDAQDVRGEDGKILHFGTPAWDAAYASRINAMMSALTGTGAEVLWLGLPPMRAAGFDSRMRHLNTLFEGEAAHVSGVVFQETGTAVASKDGKFVSFLPGPGGRLVRVRHEDGVHYAEAGSKRVADRVAGWIDKQLGKEPPPAM
jgi:uncharacterized protein